MKKSVLISICGIIVSQAAFASKSVDFVRPFIGGGIGISTNDQNLDVAENYGIPYSTFSSNNPNFTYGVNLGVRILDDSYIYHPGAQLFYNGITGTANLNVATIYGGTDFDVDASHKLIGGGFDNYIRVAHNEKSDFFSNKWDGFVVLGVEVGKIKSKYTISLSGTDYNIHDDGNFYGAKIEYLAEEKQGGGLTISVKLLKPDTDAISTIFLTRWGLRYTF